MRVPCATADIVVVLMAKVMDWVGFEKRKGRMNEERGVLLAGCDARSAKRFKKANKQSLARKFCLPS